MRLLTRFEVSPLNGERRASALELLTDDERARMATDKMRAEGFLTGRMLLRELASELTALPLASIPVAASCPDCGLPHGRPTLPDIGLFASISHAGDLTAVAVADRPVGIDVELRDASPERLAAIREVTGRDGLDHWVAVEAVLKADGRGLRVDPRDVRVVGDKAALEGVEYDLTALKIGDDRHVARIALRR